MTRLLLTLVILLTCWTSAASAQGIDAKTLLQQHIASIVKITVTGMTADKRLVTKEGSGTIILSQFQLSVIATASHVVGTNSDWDSRPDGKPNRSITVQLWDPASKRLGYPISAAVHEQSAGQDWALLIMAGGNDQITAMGSSLAVVPGTPVVLAGYPTGQTSPDPQVGTAGADDFASVGFALRLSGLDVLNGMSGGPVLNAAGQIVGIASQDLGAQPGIHYAAPISEVRNALNQITAATAPSISAELLGGPSAIVHLEGNISGSGNGAIAGGSAEVALGEQLRLDQRGTESSECDADSGRTLSHGRVVAKAEQTKDGSIVLDTELVAQGGSYRTADACIAHHPVGLHPHDTSTHAEYRFNAAISVPVDPATTSQLKFSWTEVPRGHLVALSPDGTLLADVPLTASGGEQVLDITTRGAVSLQVSVFEAADRGGACCGVDDSRSMRFSVSQVTN